MKNKKSAFDAAVNCITYRDRSRKELYDKLKEKGYSSSEIDDALDKMVYYGYINDERYAFSYIKSNINKKGSGLIERELLNKGVDDNIISNSLEEFGQDEETVISEILERRYRDADFSDEKHLRRIYGFLVRRGFKYDNICKSVANYKKMQ